ncbi:hypothetical protein M501DRAFT_355129 [Patellaria atrata CBS 101060]|uniref:Zn(2)-C6 fungal-type domain-containing protein n=1 Tax=Patellaria atrata CBS 101060 TaxID=1346257 RepID=A0A9P4SFC9_9PEZI|nr:hypothetical protein M501DRAFT_355129 [Patellaria atrata CBS 101060]
MSDPSTANSNKQRADRACQTCAVAKAKCIPRAGTNLKDKCTRCHRLSKICVPQPEPVAKKRVPRTRVARLEQKLDGIMSLLSSHEEQAVATPHVNPSVRNRENQDCIIPNRSNSLHGQRSAQSQGNFGASNSSKGQALLRNSVAHSQGYSVFGLHTPPVSEGQSPSTLAQFPDDLMSWSEAEALFASFKNTSSQYFPFVPVSDEISAAELFEKKPFLFRVICLTASYEDIPKSTKLGEWLMHNISDQLLLKGEKNMDLLQGLLVFIGWYHPQFYLLNQLTNLIQLTRALVIELGMSKPASAWDSSNIMRASMKGTNNCGMIDGCRTLETKRAVLGCYYLQSTIATTFKRLDLPVFTPHLDQCCKALEETKELQSDMLLVKTVRLQSILEKIYRTIPLDEPMPSALTIPIELYINSIRAELEIFKNTIPMELQGNTQLLLQFHRVEITLYEIGLEDIAIGPCYGDRKLDRLTLLYQCLRATKDFMTLFLEIPGKDWISNSFAPLAHSSTAIKALSRLSLYEGFGWDRSYVRQTIDFIEVLHRCMGKCEEISGGPVNAPPEDKSFFRMSAWKLKLMLNWYKSRTTGSHPQSLGEDTVEQTVQDMNIGEFNASVELLDGLDQAFWNDVMSGLDGMIGL